MVLEALGTTQVWCYQRTSARINSYFVAYSRYATAVKYAGWSLSGWHVFWNLRRSCFRGGCKNCICYLSGKFCFLCFVLLHFGYIALMFDLQLDFQRSACWCFSASCRWRAILSLLLVATALDVSAQSFTLYVDPSGGNDTNGCGLSRESACRTIEKANFRSIEECSSNTFPCADGVIQLLSGEYVVGTFWVYECGISRFRYTLCFWCSERTVEARFKNIFTAIQNERLVSAISAWSVWLQSVFLNNLWSATIKEHSSHQISSMCLWITLCSDSDTSTASLMCVFTTCVCAWGLMCAANWTDGSQRIWLVWLMCQC